MKVEITKESLESLAEDAVFMINELGVPKEQIRLLRNKLLKSAKSLTNYPYRGQYEPTLNHKTKKYRRLINGNYKIIYRVEDNIIYITDFFDARKDPSKIKV